MSTSTSKSVLNELATTFNIEKKVSIRIRTPEGTSVINMDKTFPGSRFFGEQEFLLKRNTKFEVINIKDKGEGNFSMLLEIVK